MSMFKHSRTAWAVMVGACVFSSGTTFAQQSQTQQSQSTQQVQTDQTSGQQDENQWLNELASKVELNDDQKSQIRSVIEQHNEKLRSTWQQFNQAHLNAVALEAAFVAAIEDNFDSQQREQFRQSHQQAADKQTANHSTAPNQDSRQKELRETEFRQTKEQAAATDSADQEAIKRYESKPNEDKQNQNKQDLDKQDESQPNDSRQSLKSESSEQREYEYVDSQSTNASEMYVTTLILVPVRECCDSVSMDQQTQHQCDETCSKYKAELTKAWQSVHQYHADLVKLEAEKIRDVERVLTEDQLMQLKEMRSGSSINQRSDG